MAAYERHCDAAFECWTTKHLEDFVRVIAGGRARGGLEMDGRRRTGARCRDRLRASAALP